MNRIFLFYLVIIFVAATVVVAEIPNLINYQGCLTDSEGSLVANGDYQISFAIYEQAIEGTVLWSSPPQNVFTTAFVVMSDIAVLSIARSIYWPRPVCVR